MVRVRPDDVIFVERLLCCKHEGEQDWCYVREIMSEDLYFENLWAIWIVIDISLRMTVFLRQMTGFFFFSLSLCTCAAARIEEEWSPTFRVCIIQVVGWAKAVVLSAIFGFGEAELCKLRRFLAQTVLGQREKACDPIEQRLFSFALWSVAASCVCNEDIATRGREKGKETCWFGRAGLRSACRRTGFLVAFECVDKDWQIYRFRSAWEPCLWV